MIYGVITASAVDDRELARRCAAGERAAQGELFHHYRKRVHATLHRILGSNRDMEDLIQDSFLQVFHSIGSFRGEAKLATWINRVTARVAYNYISHRRATTVALESVPELEARDPSAEQKAMAREAVRRLYMALDRVEAKQRIAFALHAIDGRSLREVAEITDSTVMATKTRVWRARKELDRRARKDPLLAQYLKSKEKGS